MAKIKNIIASEIINSRGYPTIFAKLILDNDKEVSISTPSLETLYNYQVLELKDNDENRFKGNGVQKAVYYINNLIAPKLKGVSIDKQIEIDNWLLKADPSERKEKLGVNTLFTISSLIAKASALDKGIFLYQEINNLFKKITNKDLLIEKLPSPIFPILIGGRHGQINLDFKEFQIIPSSSFSYSIAYQKGVEIYHLLRHLYKFNFSFNLDVLSSIQEIIKKENLGYGRDVFLGVNLGSQFFYSGYRYALKDKPLPIPNEEMFNFIIDSIIKKYSPLVLTDCFSNDDFSYWSKLNSQISKEVYLFGDELIGSNKKRAEKAIKEKALNSVVLRLNQIGTITEMIIFVYFLKENNITLQIASDLGETIDSFIVDFSVGVQADFVNFGPPVHGENVSKYNRLLEIENQFNK